MEILSNAWALHGRINCKNVDHNAIHCGLPLLWLLPAAWVTYFILPTQSLKHEAPYEMITWNKIKLKSFPWRGQQGGITSDLFHIKKFILSHCMDLLPHRCFLLKQCHSYCNKKHLQTSTGKNHRYIMFRNHTLKPATIIITIKILPLRWSNDIIICGNSFMMQNVMKNQSWQPIDDSLCV